MSDNFTRLSDTINANEGKAYITINGSIRELFEITSLKAQLDYKVITKRMLGKRMDQHKIVGAEGTGSATLYFANGQLLKQALEYLKSGAFSGITLQVYNEDPQSTVGRNEVRLYNVILKTIMVANLDMESEDPISWDTDLTFDGVEGLSSFVLPENYR